jgi:hypothetical protein
MTCFSIKWIFVSKPYLRKAIINSRNMSDNNQHVNQQMYKTVESKYVLTFFISNFRCLLKDVFFLLGNPPASEYYVPTFRNTVSSIFIGDVSRKSKWDEIYRVLVKVKVWLKIA